MASTRKTKTSSHQLTMTKVFKFDAEDKFADVLYRGMFVYDFAYS